MALRQHSGWAPVTPDSHPHARPPIPCRYGTHQRDQAAAEGGPGLREAATEEAHADGWQQNARPQGATAHARQRRGRAAHPSSQSETHTQKVWAYQRIDHRAVVAAGVAVRHSHSAHRRLQLNLHVADVVGVDCEGREGCREGERGSQGMGKGEAAARCRAQAQDQRQRQRWQPGAGAEGRAAGTAPLFSAPVAVMA